MVLIPVTEEKEKEQFTDPRSLAGNFFHFLDYIAIPRMSDLIFRRRLVCTSQYFRNKCLRDIRKFLKDGGRFDVPLTDAELSTKRDYTLLFGTNDEILKALKDETKILPANQKHKLHEQYALLTDLFLDADPDPEQLKAALGAVGNAPQVQAAWKTYWLIQEEDEGDDHAPLHGPKFEAKSTANVDKFCNEVNEALAAWPKIANKHVGLCALGFLEPDPALLDPKNIETERKIVLTIAKLMEQNHAHPICRPECEDVNEGSWNTEMLPDAEA